MADTKYDDIEIDEQTAPKSHPSYGAIVLTKSQGGARTLNGSSITHNDTITMSLHEATLDRSLHKDWWFPRKKLFEIEMSYTQFAEMISSFGIGEGTPVTIRKRIDMPTATHDEMKPPSNNKFEQLTGEFKRSVLKANSHASEIISELKKKLSDSKPMKKAEREDFIAALTQLQNEIGSNLAFANSSFSEQTEITIKEAKGEIEAFFDAKLRHIADRAIAAKSDELLDLKAPTIDLSVNEKKGLDQNDNKLE